MIKNDLNFYMKNFKGHIEKDICQKTIKELSENNDKFYQHTFYNPILDKRKPQSGSQELDVSKINISTKPYIMDKLWHALDGYLKHVNLPFFSYWQGYTDIRWNKYGQNKKMKEHCDHIHSVFQGNRKGIPILSILGSLNNDYEGGELIFFGDKEVELKQGDVLIFPSIFLYPHRVEPVKKGVRWSYVSWVW